MRTADPCKRPQLNLSRRELSHKHCASSESQRDVNQLSEKRQKSHQKLSEIECDLNNLQEKLEMFGNRFREASQRLVIGAQQKPKNELEDIQSRDIAEVTIDRSQQAQYEQQFQPEQEPQQHPKKERNNLLGGNQTDIHRLYYRSGKKKVVKDNSIDQLRRLYQLSQIPMAYFTDMDLLRGNKLFTTKSSNGMKKPISRSKIRIKKLSVNKKSQSNCCEHSRAVSTVRRPTNENVQEPKEGDMTITHSRIGLCTAGTVAPLPLHNADEHRILYRRCMCCSQQPLHDSELLDAQNQHKSLMRKLIRTQTIKHARNHYKCNVDLKNSTHFSLEKLPCLKQQAKDQKEQSEMLIRVNNTDRDCQKEGNFRKRSPLREKCNSKRVEDVYHSGKKAPLVSICNSEYQKENQHVMGDKTKSIHHRPRKASTTKCQANFNKKPQTGSWIQHEHEMDDDESKDIIAQIPSIKMAVALRDKQNIILESGKRKELEKDKSVKFIDRRSLDKMKVSAKRMQSLKSLKKASNTMGQQPNKQNKKNDQDLKQVEGKVNLTKIDSRSKKFRNQNLISTEVQHVNEVSKSKQEMMRKSEDYKDKAKQKVKDKYKENMRSGKQKTQKSENIKPIVQNVEGEKKGQALEVKRKAEKEKQRSEDRRLKEMTMSRRKNERLNNEQMIQQKKSPIKAESVPRKKIPVDANTTLSTGNPIRADTISPKETLVSSSEIESNTDIILANESLAKAESVPPREGSAHANQKTQSKAETILAKEDLAKDESVLQKESLVKADCVVSKKSPVKAGSKTKSKADTIPLQQNLVEIGSDLVTDSGVNAGFKIESKVETISPKESQTSADIILQKENTAGTASALLNEDSANVGSKTGFNTEAILQKESLMKAETIPSKEISVKEEIILQKESPINIGSETESNTDEIFSTEGNEKAESANAEIILPKESLDKVEFILSKEDPVKVETILSKEGSVKAESVLSKESPTKVESILPKENLAEAELVLSKESPVKQETILSKQRSVKENTILQKEGLTKADSVSPKEDSGSTESVQAKEGLTNSSSKIESKANIIQPKESQSTNDATQTKENPTKDQTILPKGSSVKVESIQPEEDHVNGDLILTQEDPVKVSSNTEFKADTIQSMESPLNEETVLSKESSVKVECVQPKEESANTDFMTKSQTKTILSKGCPTKAGSIIPEEHSANSSCKIQSNTECLLPKENLVEAETTSSKESSGKAGPALPNESLVKAETILSKESPAKSSSKTEFKAESALPKKSPIKASSKTESKVQSIMKKQSISKVESNSIPPLIDGSAQADSNPLQSNISTPLQTIPSNLPISSQSKISSSSHSPSIPLPLPQDNSHYQIGSPKQDTQLDNDMPSNEQSLQNHNNINLQGQNSSSVKPLNNPLNSQLNESSVKSPNPLTTMTKPIIQSFDKGQSLSYQNMVTNSLNQNKRKTSGLIQKKPMITPLRGMNDNVSEAIELIQNKQELPLQSTLNHEKKDIQPKLCRLLAQDQVSAIVRDVGENIQQKLLEEHSYTNIQPLGSNLSKNSSTKIGEVDSQSASSNLKQNGKLQQTSAATPSSNGVITSQKVQSNTLTQPETQKSNLNSSSPTDNTIIQYCQCEKKSLNINRPNMYECANCGLIIEYRDRIGLVGDNPNSSIQEQTTGITAAMDPAKLRRSPVEARSRANPMHGRKSSDQQTGLTNERSQNLQVAGLQREPQRKSTEQYVVSQNINKQNDKISSKINQIKPRKTSETGIQPNNVLSDGVHTQKGSESNMAATQMPSTNTKQADKLKKTDLSYGSIFNIEIHREGFNRLPSSELNVQSKIAEPLTSIISGGKDNIPETNDVPETKKIPETDNIFDTNNTKVIKKEQQLPSEQSYIKQERLTKQPNNFNYAEIRKLLCTIGSEQSECHRLLHLKDETEQTRRGISKSKALTQIGSLPNKLLMAFSIVKMYLGSQFVTRLFEDAINLNKYDRAVVWLCRRGLFQPKTIDTGAIISQSKTGAERSKEIYEEILLRCLDEMQYTQQFDTADWLQSVTGGPSTSILLGNKSQEKAWKILCNATKSDIKEGMRVYGCSPSSKEVVWVKSTKVITNIANQQVRLVCVHAHNKDNFLCFDQFIQIYREVVFSYANKDYFFDHLTIPLKGNTLDETYFFSLHSSQVTKCVISFWREKLREPSKSLKTRLLLYYEQTKNHYKYQGKCENTSDKFYFEAELSKGHYIIIVEGMIEGIGCSVSTYSSHAIQVKPGRWMLQTNCTMQNDVQSFIRVKDQTQPLKRSSSRINL